MDGMQLALSEAKRALSEGEIPVGAALFHGDELLWSDHNRRESSGDPTAHAEMLCLKKRREKSRLLASGGLHPLCHPRALSDVRRRGSNVPRRGNRLRRRRPGKGLLRQSL